MYKKTFLRAVNFCLFSIRITIATSPPQSIRRGVEGWDGSLHRSESQLKIPHLTFLVSLAARIEPFLVLVKDGKYEAGKGLLRVFLQALMYRGDLEQLEWHPQWNGS